MPLQSLLSFFTWGLCSWLGAKEGPMHMVELTLYHQYKILVDSTLASAQLGWKGHFLSTLGVHLWAAPTSDMPAVPASLCLGQAACCGHATASLRRMKLLVLPGSWPQHMATPKSHSWFQERL